MAEDTDIFSEKLGFSIALIAIEVCLFMNALSFLLGLLPFSSGDIFDEFLKAAQTPSGFASCVSACIFILMLTPFKIFETLLFFAFSCAGFWGYLAYCDNSNVVLPIAYWLAIGLLTRRLGVWLTSVVAIVAVGLGACYNFLNLF